MKETWARLLYVSSSILAISAALYYLEGPRLLSVSRHIPRWHARHLDLSSYPSALSNAFIFATSSPKLDPFAVHPIHALMAQAEKEWEHKLATQSRTLAEVEAEYRRRYSLEPPPGLDRWFAYCQANNVTLLDEYDSIMDDIRPFLAISGAKVRQRLRALVEPPADRHFLIRVKDHVRLPTEGSKAREPVSKEFEDNIDQLLDYLPDVDVAVAIDDAPFGYLDYAMRKESEEALRRGVELDDEALMRNRDGDLLHTKRERMCPPDSNMHRYQDGLLQLDTRLPDGPSFIKEHSQAVNFCNVPGMMPLNGAISQLDHVTDRLIPSWAMSHMARISADVLWPPRILYDLNPPNETPFREKMAHKVIWRGSPDGVAFMSWTQWRRSHRYRLVKLANSNETSDTRRLRLTDKTKLGAEYQRDEYHSLAALNQRYLNVKATAPVFQGPENFTKLINADFPYDPVRLSLDEMADHRYVLDVDGNGYSARFRTHLRSWQVPLKATVWNDWHEGRLVPWLHYVPIRQDYSDLYNVVAFFDGGLDEKRTGNHDDLAEKIALAGREWAHTYWRHEDMQAYLLRALLEWARVIDLQRTNTKKLSDEQYWD